MLIIMQAYLSGLLGLEDACVKAECSTNRKQCNLECWVCQHCFALSILFLTCHTIFNIAKPLDGCYNRESWNRYQPE